MKKILSILLTLAFSCGILASCTGDPGMTQLADSTTPAPSTTTEAPATTTTPEPDTNEPATNEPATNEPATNEPTTDEPTTDEPATDEPATDAPSVDTTGAACINDIDGVDARVYAFENPTEFGGPVGLIYYFEDKANNTHVAMADTIANGGWAVVSIDGQLFKIEQYANGAPWFRFNVETPGATIISGVVYDIIVYVYDAEGTLKYYTNEGSMASTISTANAPTDRTALNIELPANLNKVTADTSTVTAEAGFNPWGDGPAVNLLDGNTTGTKIGGQTNGTVSVSFSLTEAATVTYYSLYTGGDTATNSNRNPAAWTLYGEVNGEWVVLAEVAASNTHVTGLGATNSTPYSYAVTNPQACQNYKIVFTTGGAFQLNELELYVG